MKLFGFGVDFINVNFKLGTSYGFERTAVTKVFSRVFVDSFNVKLQTL